MRSTLRDCFSFFVFCVKKFCVLREKLQWIYAELQTARMTRKKKPERFKKFHFAVTLGTQLKIEFDPQLPNLLLLSAEDLEKWCSQQHIVSEDVYHLDLLYLQKQIII